MLDSDEFAGNGTFTPPHRQWMAELEEFRFWFNTSDREMGVVMAIARMTDSDWPILWEGLVHDAASERTRVAGADAIEEMKAFAFGFPTALRLQDGELFATWWASLDGGPTGISWARLRVID